MDRFCACAVPATATASNATMRASNLIESSYGFNRILPHAGFGIVPAMTHAQQAQSLRHLRIEAATVTVHGDDERAETVDAKLPQRFRVEVVEVDVLDGFDPGGLERRGAADDGEVHAAHFAEGIRRVFPQAALADDDPHPVFAHQRPGEALHAVARGGADAERLVARGISRARLHLAHIGRGMDYRVAGEVEPGFAAAIEHVNLGRVADAEERATERDSVVHPELADRDATQI